MCAVFSVAMAQQLPAISAAVKSDLFTMGGSGLVNLWEHGLRLQAKDAGIYNLLIVSFINIEVTIK